MEIRVQAASKEARKLAHTPNTIVMMNTFTSDVPLYPASIITVSEENSINALELSMTQEEQKSSTNNVHIKCWSRTYRQ